MNRVRCFAVSLLVFALVGCGANQDNQLALVVVQLGDDDVSETIDLSWDRHDAQIISSMVEGLFADKPSEQTPRVGLRLTHPRGTKLTMRQYFIQHVDGDQYQLMGGLMGYEAEVQAGPTDDYQFLIQAASDRVIDDVAIASSFE